MSQRFIPHAAHRIAKTSVTLGAHCFVLPCGADIPKVFPSFFQYMLCEVISGMIIIVKNAALTVHLLSDNDKRDGQAF